MCACQISGSSLKPQGGPYVQKGEHDPLEHRTGLVHGPLQALVVVHVELAVVLIFARALARQTDVLPDGVQEHDLEE